MKVWKALIPSLPEGLDIRRNLLRGLKQVFKGNDSRRCGSRSFEGVLASTQNPLDRQDREEP